MQVVVKLQGTLYSIFALKGMQTGKLGHLGYLLIDFGIVFHGA